MDKRDARTEPSHPHIGRNIYPHSIICFCCFEVMIPHEHHLHPSLPFFRLIARKQLTVLRFSSRKVNCNQQQHKRQEYKHVTVVGSLRAREVMDEVAYKIVNHDGPNDAQ